MRVLTCILPRRPSAQQVQPLTKSLTIFMPKDYDFRGWKRKQQFRAKPRVGILRSCENNGTRTDLRHSTLSKTQLRLWAMNTRSRRIRTRDFGAFQCVYSLHHFIASWKPSAVPPTLIQSTLPSTTFALFAVQAFRAICASQHQCAAPGKMCVAKRSFFFFLE